MSYKTQINGWLNLNKPLGITSAKAVAIVKRSLHPHKIGHAGTLDPLACGVLPLALGEATKTMQFCMDSNKEYEFTVKWGEATTTYDSEGEVVSRSDVRPGREEILKILPQFTGVINQVPPIYSAIKINGKRAYDLARNGEVVSMKSRQIQIFNLEFLGIPNMDIQYATFRVACGKGTYVRSLAHDIAAALGALAHVTVLIRTKVGKFSLKDAILLEDIEKTVYKDAPSGVLLPVDTVLDDIQVLEFTTEEANCLRHGQKLPLQSILSYKNDKFNKEGGIFIAKNHGKVIAICEYGAGLVRSLRVFNL